MRHVFKISFIILFVSSLAGCLYAGNKWNRVLPITNNVRLVEWFDDIGNRTPEKDQYQVRIEGDWYEATLKTEHPHASALYKREHFELTPRSKRILEAQQRGDSGGDSGW